MKPFTPRHPVHPSDASMALITRPVAAPVVVLAAPIPEPMRALARLLGRQAAAAWVKDITQPHTA